MNRIAAGLFIIGVILIALSLTYVLSKALLLIGILIGGAGILSSKVFKE